MKIHPLKDGDFLVTKEKTFHYLEKSEGLKGLKMATQPFLIETTYEVILLDAGLGLVENGIPTIWENIYATGLQPKDVSKILLSHLHKDHIDGLVNTSEEGWKLNFPEAEVYLQKREYDFALSKSENPSFDLEVLDFIIKNAKIVWMNEDKGNLSSEISFEVTGGHTPYHQVFFIRENGETAFYGADNLPTTAYLKYQIAFKTDFDGKLAMEARNQWEKRAKEEYWKILLYHDMEQAILEL
ncbi:MBL fold metallo-hydrolase [Chryseobacterium sp. CH21]|uniref:MBL fold metallo-hydrolase n=1 Tax=Chryseobacterium sp. CH21 TaxID=713556 RepID=UPI00100AB9D7|nr:MBL fold metallo-hydrolase [Chryseobacterium sp. CH21]RXM39118.1 MBL fold metallo-hydrolase [Chryseobacterium sp. CH21]